MEWIYGCLARSCWTGEDARRSIVERNADHRNLQIASRRVHLCRDAVRICAADRLQSSLHLVRHRIQLLWRKKDDSGEGDTFHIENLETLRPHDEIKFVISGRSDYEFARDFTARHDLARRVNAVLFSPAFRKDASGARDASNCLVDPQELAEWMLEDNVPARLGLQIHKLIWDPAMKSV